MTHEHSETVWISPAETAQLLGVARSTLTRWRSEGRGPEWRRYGETGRFILYDRAKVEEFDRKYGPFTIRKKPRKRTT